jgi:putative lipoic acid-binding regulatory protein
MIPKDNPEEFYSRFHEQLTDSQDWPGPFLFKFIIRGDEEKIDRLKQIFEDKRAKLKLKNSSKNTFVSVTFLAEMENPDEVISIYKAASSIEGIITL